ncbi:MAG: GxxExxY protein [Flavobacteriia bacterium]|nr:GxxExxY protein [Flavobacteriia bacterium]
MTINEISGEILDAAIEVHNHLGPGLLESVYEEVLCVELKSRGINVQRQVSVPLKYKGQPIDKNLYIDLFVENQVVVELKSVQKLKPVHSKQVLTYLRLSNSKLGLLINFNEDRVSKGFKRIIL